ncbi:MAG: transporter substrate-binding domain-containing protein [Bdellovibrionales bacterium]|nr:transporter substrate-binding domain-containing protein [Bdellovibrionales bacterium]NQZ20186.1 transporter substrate-binding domain-containing protein [Bdellovibrionales bacterium]
MKILCCLLLVLLTSCSTSSQKLKPLRVGTTGDYAPFSETAGDSFKGIDIDLAKELGKALNREILLVKTSWPTLIEDLKNKKFDIAMSGISIKPEREKWGFFSYPYVQYGKMPIARCKDVQKLKTLGMIDQEKIRVAVNPGGTNESFARKTIKKAKIVTFQNNSQIFQHILDNKADVMMTDSIEVFYQSKKHKGKLCPTMDKTLTESHMGIYMVKDKALLEDVNQWLAAFTTSGQLNQIMDRYLK